MRQASPHLDFLIQRLTQAIGDTSQRCLGPHICNSLLNQINPFQAISLFQYPLKASENQGFFDVVRGY